jgi:hypothetical protein
MEPVKLIDDRVLLKFVDLVNFTAILFSSYISENNPSEKIELAIHFIKGDLS